MMGKTDGDNYTLDDMFVSSAAQREGEGRDEERMRARAVQEHRRLAATMDRCQHCFSNPELQKHLLIAIGSKVGDRLLSRGLPNPIFTAYEYFKSVCACVCVFRRI